MSKDRRIMRVMSILMFPWGVVCLVLGVISYFGIGATGFSVLGLATVVLVFAGALLSLLAGVCGVRGASTPSKAAPFVKLSMLMLVDAVAIVALLLVGRVVSVDTGTVAAVLCCIPAALSLAGLLAGRKIVARVQR